MICANRLILILSGGLGPHWYIQDTVVSCWNSAFCQWCTRKKQTMIFVCLIMNIFSGLEPLLLYVKTFESESSFISTQCTMGKLKNRVKSCQLWQIISPWILTQKFPNFAHSCINSSKTQINTNIWQMRKNSKKPVGGVYASQIYIKKNLLTKEFNFITETFCVNTPK